MLVISLLIFSSFVVGSNADGFVEEVACSGGAMTIVVNKSDADVVKWMRDPSARPILYVYGHKERAPCGIALKSTVGENASSSHGVYNLTIPYGPTCSVYLADLEPSFQTAETTVAIENNAAFENTRGLRINHVFCLYTKQVEAIRINDVINDNEVAASVGGKPKPKVQMLFRDPDGRPLKAAKFGDPVGLYLMLSPDNAYKAISPKHCMFSDREKMEEPDAKTLTFVQSHCPVTELSDVIRPVQDLNEEIYFTHFQAFRFGQRSTVYAHCKVEVCLDQDDCQKKKCYQKVDNASITAESLRFRFRRGADDHRISGGSIDTVNEATSDEVALSNVLTVFETQQPAPVISRSTEACVDQRLGQCLFIIIAILCVLLLLSLIGGACLFGKLRRAKKTAIAAMNFSSVSPYYYAHPPSSSSSTMTGTTLASHGLERMTRHGSLTSLALRQPDDFGTMRSGVNWSPQSGYYTNHAIPRVKATS